MLKIKKLGIKPVYDISVSNNHNFFGNGLLVHNCGGLWTAKKRYAILVNDNEGVKYDPPYLKVTGLEIVKKDTPEIMRDELKKIVRMILETHDNDKLIKEISTFKCDFLDKKIYHYDEIATTKSVNGISKYQDNLTIYRKGTPKNSRSAILHNKLLLDNNITTREPIKEGNKIKMINLMLPNTLKEDVIGYIGNIPPEFNLERYIDYRGTYEKSFEKPLTSIFNAIGWDIEETAGFGDFF